MYGIGMKRAIFKLGRSATGDQRPGRRNPLRVDISPKWMEEDIWELELIDVDERLPDGSGTKIRIEQLNDHISHQFDERGPTSSRKKGSRHGFRSSSP